jgi:hypothetical protein
MVGSHRANNIIAPVEAAPLRAWVYLGGTTFNGCRVDGEWHCITETWKRYIRVLDGSKARHRADTRAKKTVFAIATVVASVALSFLAPSMPLTGINLG